MSNEIGEILIRLKDKQVIDFEKKIPIVLLDRSAAPVEFKRTDVIEMKRFISLVQHHLPALTYLARHISFTNVTRDVVRSDRVMGSIDYAKTMKLKQQIPSGKNRVVCLEIARSYDTPENVLLAMILFSIMIYCDKCLSLEALVESRDKLNPTIRELRTIRSYVSNLLSVKGIKNLVPNAIDSLENVDHLFEDLRKRILLGRVPSYYADILRLFERWRNYFWVALDDKEVLKHVLRYHFMRLKDLNDMYECWVFCKILYALSVTFNLKLTESSSKVGAAVFRSEKGEIKVIYQASYETDWQRGDRFIRDVPDIAVELGNGIRFILDAKNSYYKSGVEPYFLQLQSYVTSANATFGIVIHSAAEEIDVWDRIENRKDKREIISTSISPGNDTQVSHSLTKILDLIISYARQ
ncbi:MAG: hypothetical protein ABI347_10550 [Nitrososphaera sp.]|jgi:hypothetical protein